MAFNHFFDSVAAHDTAMVFTYKKNPPAKPGVFHMRAKPYVTGNTQVCVKQLTLAYEQPHKTKAPLPKGGCPSECEDWGILIKRT